MAVIQDLPAELLYRILELMEDTQVDLFQQAETRRTFAHTCLVARSWCGPSQHFLASTLHTYTRTPLLKRYLKSAPDRSTFHSTMQYLEVRGSQSSADELASLQQRGIAVQELEVYADGLHLNSAHVRILQRVRRLTLWGSVKLEGDLGRDTTLMLESRHISCDLTELPAFMLPLSAVAPRLTRLTLDHRYFRLSDSFDAPLKKLALQLRHLHLELNSISPLQKDGFDLDRFLSTCTSLTSFQVDRVRPFDLKHILSSLSSPLVLLNVHLILRSAEGARQLMTVQLAGVFNLPCMAKLQRWRMSSREYDVLGGRREISESAMEEWRVACRERGIEPRGAERYFTD